MSLYVFNVTPTTAVVTADTRQCATIDGTIYRLNDTTAKLRVINGTIVTVGGVAWVCTYILNQWENGIDHSVQRLHDITMATLPHIGELAAQFGVGHIDFLSNPYLLEFCILKYDSQLGYNVFFHIATSTGYHLERFDVDGVIHPSAMTFGGIDFDVVKEYFNAHPGQVKWDYIDAVHAAYELAVSEKIGGNLMIANQNKGSISLSKRKLKDRRPLREAAELFYPALNVVGQYLEIHCPDTNGGVHKVAIDSMGLFQYNGRYYMAGDDGGKIGMDHHWGIFGGPNALFDVTDTGYVKPSFVDDDGKMILDKDGFPKDTDFLLGMNRKHFFRGTIHAVDGIFNGTVFAKDGQFDGVIKARDYLDSTGTSMLTSDGKFASKHLDLGNIQLNGPAGDISMTGSIDMGGNIKLKGNIDLSEASKILFGKNTVVKVKYSTNKNATIPSGWSDTWNSSWSASTSTEVWAINSYDGGDTWVGPVLMQGKSGTNGAPGSDGTDGDPKKYLEEIGITELSGSQVKSPWIKGGLVEGGELRVNGNIISAARGDKSELGVYDEYGDKYGYIRFDDTGKPSTPYEAQKRMFIATEGDKALKIQSGGNLSIQSNDGNGIIYMKGKVSFSEPPIMHYVLA